MAAKKKTMTRLPPMYPRVVVADALAAAEARSRFLAAMQDLSASGVVERVMRFVRIERGVWLREGHGWPAAIRRIAERAIRTAELLEEVGQSWNIVSDATVPPSMRPVMESHASHVLQLLMDEVYEAGKDIRPRPAVALAGLSGPAGELAAMRCSSGVEGAINLAFCVRHAVLGGRDSPFWPYLVSARSKRGMRKQVGRVPPSSVSELYPDDLSILQACLEGALVAKLVAARVKLSESHVSKRKRDLRKWGLLTRARSFELSSTGRRWLREVPLQ